MKPISEWTVEEVNVYLHEKVMGKCWHEEDVIDTACRKCDDFFISNPNYCSSSEPRRLREEVVAKVKRVALYDALCEQLDNGERHTLRLYIADASAEQIARACVSAHLEGK